MKQVVDETTAEQGSFVSNLWSNIKDSLGFGKEFKIEIPEVKFDANATQAYVDMVTGLHDFMGKEMPDALSEMQKGLEEGTITSNRQLQYAVGEMETYIKNKRNIDSESFQRYMTTAIAHSGLPDDIQNAFITAFNTEGVNKEFIATHVSSLITAVQEAGLLVASEGESTKPKTFDSDWSKEYKAYIEGEYAKYLDQNATALNRGFEESGEKTMADYLKSTNNTLEDWYKANEQYDEATYTFFNTQLPELAYSMGVKVDGMKNVTSENIVEVKDFLADYGRWEELFKSAMWGNEDPDFLKTQLLEIVEGVTDPAYFETFKSEFDTWILGQTNKQTAMQMLFAALNGDMEAIREIVGSIEQKVKSGGGGGGGGASTTQGQTRGTLSEFDKAVESYNAARLKGDKEAEWNAKNQIMWYYGASYNDDVDTQISNTERWRDPNLENWVMNHIDEVRADIGESVNRGLWSQATYNKGRNIDVNARMQATLAEQQRQQELQEAEKERLDYLSGGKAKVPETEEPDLADNGLFSFLFGGSLDEATVNAIKGLIEAGGLGGLFGGLDEATAGAWASMTDVITALGTNLPILKDVISADEGGNAFSLEGLIPMIDEEAVASWVSISEPLGMVANAMDQIKTVLLGEDGTGGLGTDFSLASLFPTLETTTIDSWTLFAGSLLTVKDSLLGIMAALTGGEMGEDGEFAMGDADAGAMLADALNIMGDAADKLAPRLQEGLNPQLFLMQDYLNAASSATNDLIKMWTGSWATAVGAFVETSGPAIGTAEALAASAQKAAAFYHDWAGAIQAVIDNLKRLAALQGEDKKDGGGGGGNHAGGGQIPPFSTAIVGEHGPEFITSGSRRLNVFTNTSLQHEIASARHSLNTLANSADIVAYNRLMGSSSSNTSNDNSQHFTNNFTGAILGDDAFREMIDEEVREVWRREMRLAS